MYAAGHDEREVFYGYPTYKTILGNKVVPELLDSFLAKKGYKGQQTNEKQRADHYNNSW